MNADEIVRTLARLQPYVYEDGSWTDDQAEDAIVTLNRLIEEARLAVRLPLDSLG